MHVENYLVLPLMEVFWIGYDEAQPVLDVTTQLNRRNENSKVSQNFSTNGRMLQYRRINPFFFTDTFYVTVKAKSARGNKCMQLFVSDKGYVFVLHMEEKSEFSKALKMSIKEVSVPLYLITDSAQVQKSKEVVIFCHKIGATLQIPEESTQWADRAELYIELLKEGVWKEIHESHSLLVLWVYAAELKDQMFNMTENDLFQLQGQNPHMATFGTECDISNVCQYKLYEWVIFVMVVRNFHSCWRS